LFSYRQEWLCKQSHCLETLAPPSLLIVTIDFLLGPAASTHL
jgi:hypothetical protein